MSYRFDYHFINPNVYDRDLYIKELLYRLVFERHHYIIPDEKLFENHLWLTQQHTLRDNGHHSWLVMIVRQIYEHGDSISLDLERALFFYHQEKIQKKAIYSVNEMWRIVILEYAEEDAWDSFEIYKSTKDEESLYTYYRILSLPSDFSTYYDRAYASKIDDLFYA
jgi:hypothetical protein